MVVLSWNMLFVCVSIAKWIEYVECIACLVHDWQIDLVSRGISNGNEECM